MAVVSQALRDFVLDLRVASLAFVVALAFAAFHAPPVTASLAVLECEACIECSPGTTPLPDHECEHCSGDPPDTGWVYCSCCKGLDEQAHCCWSVPE